MMTLTDFENYLTHTISQGGVEKENGGIGYYEYWGAKCFDKGLDFLLYAGPHTITIPLEQITEDARADIEAGEADISYTFIEGDLDLTVQAKCTVQDNHVLIKIGEVK